MLQTKAVEKIKTHILCSVFFWGGRGGESCRLWGNVEKYYRAGQATDDNMAHVRIACWIPTATNIYSHYITLIALPLQQWVEERTSLLRYTYISCLVLYIESLQMLPVRK